MILLPTRNAVLFPGIVAPFGIGRPQIVAAAQAAARANKPIGVVLPKDPTVDAPDQTISIVSAPRLRFRAT